MADITNIKGGIKDNSKRRKVPEQMHAQRRKEAEERQAKYGLLTIDQKLAQPHLGKKERAKLLVKKTNSVGGKK